jgi:hypothetical protein
MYKNMIGKNAGVVWRKLRDNKTASMKELVELTGLNPTNLAFAIGWLARENKIMIYSRNDTLYFELLFHETYY